MRTIILLTKGRNSGLPMSTSQTQGEMLLESGISARGIHVCIYSLGGFSKDKPKEETSESKIDENC